MPVRDHWQVGCQVSPVILLLALALAGCLAPAGEIDPGRALEADHPVWVVDHGWHLSLVVRAEDVPDGVWPERLDVADARYLEVAWGDREFYTAPRGSLGLALKAAFASRGSVLHLVGFGVPVRTYFADREVVELRLSRDGVQALTRFIDAAHARGSATRAPRLAAPLYGAGGFYPASGRYHLLHTCNTWIVSALRAGGVPMTARRTLTAGGVLREVRVLGRPAL